MNTKTVPVLRDEAPDDWVSCCGVCYARFAVKAGDTPNGNPYPHGCFCPDCRDGRLMAPGVLHWGQRGERPNLGKAVRKLADEYRHRANVAVDIDDARRLREFAERLLRTANEAKL